MQQLVGGFEDWSAVDHGDGEGVVVVGAVMGAAQQQQIVEVSSAAVFPMDHVVDVEPAVVVTPGEGAPATVSFVDRASQRFGDQPVATSNIDDSTGFVVQQGGQDRVTRQPPSGRWSDRLIVRQMTPGRVCRLPRSPTDTCSTTSGWVLDTKPGSTVVADPWTNESNASTGANGSTVVGFPSWQRPVDAAASTGCGLSSCWVWWIWR